MESMLVIITLAFYFSKSAGQPCSKDMPIGASKPEQLTEKVDSKSGQIVIIRHQDYVVPCCGAIAEWNAYIQRSGTIRLQVWRALGTGEYTLVGENFATYHKNEENTLIKVPVVENKQIAVQGGDFIGWYNEGEPMISYTRDKKGQGVLINTVGKPVNIMATLDWSKIEASDPRSYAVQARVSKGIKPKFKNLGTTLTIVSGLSKNTQIYQLGFDGVDGVEVPKYFSAFLDDFSEFFAYNQSTNSVYIRQTPPKGKYTLSFTVKDHCGNKDSGTLKIEVETKLPSILNLPAAVSVREDAVNQERVLYELEVANSGPIACSLKNVDPVSGKKYFLVRNGNGSVSEILLKATGQLSYAQENAYELEIKCAAGKDFDSNMFYVNVEPNKAPSFTNLPSTVSVHADESIIGALIYHIEFTDEENDPVFFNVSCEPPPCPFDVTQGGNVMVVNDLRTAASSIIYLEITMEDHYNIAGPEILIVNITGVNSAPFIYNLPDKATALLAENSPPWTSVFQVKAIDQDKGDNFTFTLSAKPTSMIPLFSINETTGVIYALTTFDYEGTKSKNVKLNPIVSDGVNQYQGNLKVSIIDINEPPKFLYKNYTVYTAENDTGKVIVKGRIKAEDKDKGDVVVYGIDCGEDTDKFEINEKTADITQIYQIDIDKLGVEEHQIFCTVSATDNVGQRSNSTVRIVVIDVNDNTPDFERTSYLFIATRDLPVFSVIGRAHAVDNDTTSEHNQLFYYIEKETEDFVTDDNGTIHLMEDLSGVAIGTLFKFTMKVEDSKGKKDSAPVTVVVLDGNYNTVVTSVVTSLVIPQMTFFDYPENVAWLVSAGYLVLILIGLLVYLCCWSLSCSIAIKPKLISDRPPQPRSKVGAGEKIPGSAHSQYSRRSSVVSVYPIMESVTEERPEHYQTHHNNSEPVLVSSGPSARKQKPFIPPHRLNQHNVGVLHLSNRRSAMSTLQQEMPIDHPTDSSGSRVSKMSSEDLLSVSSRLSLSDIHPAPNVKAATPWKPWGISDFKQLFTPTHTSDSDYCSKPFSNGDKSGNGTRKKSLNF